MRPKFDNGEVIADLELGTVPVYCSACGSEGWELTSAVYDPNSEKGSVIDLIFKRSVQLGAHSDSLRKLPSGGAGSSDAEEPRTA